MSVFTVDVPVDIAADLTFDTPPWVINGSVVDLTGTACRFFIYACPSDVDPFMELTHTPTAYGSVIPNNDGTVTVTLAGAATGILPYTGGPLKYACWSDRAGSVVSVAVASPGSGYTAAPAVSFAGGSGSSASATAVIAGGLVTAVNVVDPGHGYTSAPTVTFSSGSASATVTVNTGTVSTLLQNGRLLLNATYT
jgi:hypothetical protein